MNFFKKKNTFLNLIHCTCSLINILANIRGENSRFHNEQFFPQFPSLSAIHRMHLTHVNQTKLDEKSPSPPSSFLSSPLKATLFLSPLLPSLFSVQRHIFLLRYLNPANYAYFAFACNDETIFHHYSQGKAPPSPLSRPRVSRSSRSLHRANLLECRIIPDKMTIFSSAPLCVGHRRNI